MVLFDFLDYLLNFFTASPKQDKNITPPSTPPPTSHERHDYIDPVKTHSGKMNSKTVQVVQEIPSAKDAGVLNPNTGFPEPLSPDRNTTLPHPDADTSKNATIEAGDLELTRTSSKRRFLHSRHHSIKSTTSGKIDPADYGLHDDVNYVEDAHANKEKNQKEADHTVGRSTDGVVKETNGVGPGDEAEKTDEELKIQKERDEQGYQEGERRKGVLRKMHLHKV